MCVSVCVRIHSIMLSDIQMFPLCLNVTALFLRILSERQSKKARARGMITRCHVTSNMIIVINERDMYTRVRPD